MTRFTIKLSGENYYLVQGPSGYAFARSKKRAMKFDSQSAAQTFAKILSGDLEIVEI